MRGTVKYINPHRGMVAVQTEDGEYSVFESLGGDFEINDEVSWDAHNPLGGETITNHTQQMCICVSFENHYVPLSQLRSALLMG